MAPEKSSRFLKNGDRAMLLVGSEFIGYFIVYPEIVCDNLRSAIADPGHGSCLGRICSQKKI